MEVCCFVVPGSVGFMKAGKCIGVSTSIGSSSVSLFSLASRISFAEWSSNNALSAEWGKDQRYERGSIKCHRQNMQLINISWHRKSNFSCLSKSYEENSSSVSDSGLSEEVQSSNEVVPSLNEPSDVTQEGLSSGQPGTVTFREPAKMGKLDSIPGENRKGNFIWVVGPLALIASFLFPQFVLNSAIYSLLHNDILAESIISISSEAIFYCGLAVFLKVTEHVQRPYLVYSSNQWELINLEGYLYSSYLTSGLRVIAPLLAVYAVWPAVGLPALISVAPFLIGCAAQFAFEAFLEDRKSSCWPVVPIIFEVYRLYQLTKAANFIEKLMMIMKGMPVTPELLEKSGALFSLIVVFQVLGLLGLWSLLTFLLRLFPSNPTTENANA